MNGNATTGATDGGLAKDIEILGNHGVLMFAVYTHAKMLFADSSEAAKARMSNAAHFFFQDVSQVLVEYVILQVCKVTDPPQTAGKDNLTVPFIVANYDFSKHPETKARLEALSGGMEPLRTALLQARNKRIAHIDRAAAFLPDNFGAAKAEEWNGFWAAFDEFISLVHQIAKGTEFSVRAINPVSDADTLLKSLKAAACFEQLLHEGPANITHRCADLMQASPD